MIINMGILHIDTLVTHREPTGNPQGGYREVNWDMGSC